MAWMLDIFALMVVRNKRLLFHKVIVVLFVSIWCLLGR